MDLVLSVQPTHVEALSGEKHVLFRVLHRIFYLVSKHGTRENYGLYDMIHSDYLSLRGLWEKHPIRNEYSLIGCFSIQNMSQLPTNYRFLAKPIIVLIASFQLAHHYREKAVNIILNANTFFGYSVFLVSNAKRKEIPWKGDIKMILLIKKILALENDWFQVLTRPSAANKSFPFHVRTSQVLINNNKYNN